MKKQLQNEDNEDLVLRLQSVIDTAIDGIMTINERGIVESINPAAANLFGYEPKEVIGHNIKMLMPSPDREQHDGYLERYRRTGEPRIIGIGREVEGKTKEGNVFPFRLAVSEVQFKNRRIFTGIIHNLSDVKKAEAKIRKLNQELERKVTERTDELAETVNKLLTTNQQLEHEVKERKSAEMALRKSLEREKELNELKSRFVSTASHEFRTPLSSILSSAEIINEYKTEEQQPKREKHINRIKSSVKTMTEILNDFLSLSKFEEGKVKQQPVEFLLKDFCVEVQDEIQGLLKPDQNITHYIEEDRIVFLDKRFLKNVLFNLLSNAIKYSKAGKEIRCLIKIIDNHLVIEVADQGIGMSEEDQKHIFSRFFRASNVENIQGTGLGLNIVQEYVDLMHGTIDFESKLGVGTTFKVSIPLN
ncbi:MAG: PAS domain-containing sensor histidine kinase [Saprospiraceae bacterium]|nr:MAG: PAS domain-containing sensor histidine kinase [Saprospiraceae bacterium]